MTNVRLYIGHTSSETAR